MELVSGTDIRQENIVKMIAAALNLIDPRLVSHGERVALLAYTLVLSDDSLRDIDMDLLFLLCEFHDIGAYKTEEIDEMLGFENQKIWNHSIYGYLFLKNLTPLCDRALPVLYHHQRYEALHNSGMPDLRYAALLSLADRVDLCIMDGKTDAEIETLLTADPGRFSPALVASFIKENRVRPFAQVISGDAPFIFANKVAAALRVTQEDIMAYIKMLVFSVDFRSEHTVTHTINTTAISMELAQRCHLPRHTLEKIYLGALLHDLGKVAIPLPILEYPGKLSPDEMDIMRTHVVYTEKILTGRIDDEIVQIAIRHHEKLDGSGYAYGLYGDVLSVPQRIVAVADIVSALGSRRSYKEPFPKEKTLAIVAQLAKEGKLDAQICKILAQDFDDILHATDTARDPVVSTYRAIHTEYARILKMVD
ncbi:MAG: HD domain-containing protein [Ruthenibacterium sp.]